MSKKKRERFTFEPAYSSTPPVNPDPSRYIVKRLRSRGYILVEKEIVRWKEKRKAESKRVESLHKASTLYKEQEASINDESDFLVPTPLPDFFGGS